MTENEAILVNARNVLSGRSRKGYGQTYFSKHHLRQGEVIMCGYGEPIDHQTPRLSVQVGFAQHYLPSKMTGRYWNHSCNPNTFVHTRDDGFPNLVAARDIRKGEEVVYSYFMTEFEWFRDADERGQRCRCDSENCRKKILAFSQLNQREQKELVVLCRVSEYLRRWYLET